MVLNDWFKIKLCTVMWCDIRNEILYRVFGNKWDNSKITTMLIMGSPFLWVMNRLRSENEYLINNVSFIPILHEYLHIFPWAHRNNTSASAVYWESLCPVISAVMSLENRPRQCCRTWNDWRICKNTIRRHCSFTVLSDLTNVKRPYWWLNLAAGSEKKDVIWKPMFGSGLNAETWLFDVFLETANDGEICSS